MLLLKCLKCTRSTVVCKIPLLARALGLKAKRARDDRLSCIQAHRCRIFGIQDTFARKIGYFARKI